MPQLYRTRSVPHGQPTLYQLSIRAPQLAFADFATYTFPLSPSSLRADYSAMSSYSETRGLAKRQGVTRVMDRFGLSPPVFTIEGTTGWDQHLSDGFLLNGLESMQLLKAFLNQYESLNQAQVDSGNPALFALEFYDYFSSQFWQVEPVGPQIFRQSNDKPFLTYYRFHFVAVAPVAFSLIGLVDDLANILGTPAQQAAVNLATTLTALAFAYGPTGPLVASF